MSIEETRAHNKREHDRQCVARIMGDISVLIYSIDNVLDLPEGHPLRQRAARKASQAMAGLQWILDNVLADTTETIIPSKMQ